MITLSRSGDTIVFEFENNKLYLHNGAISAPVNSLSLLIDESDIATFLKAASNDIFLSCSLDELGMTKEDLEDWFAENATGGGSINPEEVEEIVEEVTENLFGYAEYDSQNTRINFKHDASGDVITYIDASDFVIDGMIDNVEIVTVQGVKYLKITFNTESGKEPILIPLSDIFNPNEYYTKTEVDNAISAAVSGKQDTLIAGTNITISGNVISSEGGGSSYTAGSGIDITNDVISVTGKVDVDVFEEKERVISASLVDLNERKADSSAVTEAISAAVSGKQDTLISGTNIKTINNESILGSGNINIQGGSGISSAECQTMIDNSISGKADSSAVTQEISAAVSGKQDTLIAGTNITIVDNVISSSSGGGGVTPQEVEAMIDEAVSGKADTSAVTQEISAAVSGKADSSAVTQEISAAVSGKADTATTYTKTEVDSALANKADTSRLGGLSLVKLTQAEYDILPNKDANTLYVIV